jgi:histidinol dehydrogenase
MLDKEGFLKELYPIINEMEIYEQLPCHVKAADIRLLD